VDAQQRRDVLGRLTAEAALRRYAERVEVAARSAEFLVL
jgi:hypothetical protein